MGVWTVVTCLFDILSETGANGDNGSIDSDLKATELLELDVPLVMFTDPKTYPTVWQIRRRAGLLNKTFFVSLRLRDLPLWKHHHLAATKSLLYSILTTSKFSMLKRAIQLNPFDTKSIAWCDFGIKAASRLLSAAAPSEKPAFYYRSSSSPSCGFFTGKNELMLALCEAVEQEFTKHAQPAERLLSAIHARDRQAFHLQQPANQMPTNQTAPNQTAPNQNANHDAPNGGGGVVRRVLRHRPAPHSGESVPQTKSEAIDRNAVDRNAVDRKAVVEAKVSEAKERLHKHGHLRLWRGAPVLEAEARSLAAAAFADLDALVYINLDARSDRRDETVAEHKRLRVPPEKVHRFSAIKGATGCIGCNSSHLAVLKMAKQRGWRNVLICEDDFNFIPDERTVWTNLSYFFQKYGSSFDVAMLVAGGLQHLKPCDDVVCLAQNSPNAAGYIVHNSFYDTLIACWEVALEKLKQTNRVDLYITDAAWIPLQKEGRGKWFVFWPLLGYQRPSISDLTPGVLCDHNGILPMRPLMNIIEQSTIQQSTIQQSTIEQSTIEQSTIEQSTIEQSTIEQSNTIEKRGMNEKSGVGGRPRRWFCHYFDNAQKKWSESGGLRIAREAKLLRNADGAPCFDHVLTYRKDDLGLQWVAEHKEHFRHSSGAGLWVWKPRVIALTLEKMAPGDMLLYCDTGCELRSSVEPLFRLLDKQDIVPFELLDQQERRWTKGDVFAALSAHEFKDTLQRIGGISLFRNGPFAQRIVQEWSHFCDRIDLIDDSPSKVSNYPDFRDHRHDQSIWSLLTKKHKIPAFPDVSWPLHSATIVAAARRQD